MTATELIKALTEELEENGEDFEVTIFDNYCGENRDYKIFKSCFWWDRVRVKRRNRKSITQYNQITKGGE